MKDSTAIWWEPTEGKPKDVHIELDVNVWLAKKKDSFPVKLIRKLGYISNLDWFSKKYRDDYIEFGVRVYKFSKIKKVFIYLPFVISEYEIKDIIPELKDSDTANALFNEKMSVVSNHGTMYKVKYENDTKEQFLASCTDIHNNNIKKTDSGGCIITLEIPNQDAFSDILYKRIRINKISHIINEFSENNFLIDGFFKKLKTVEISINTTRKLPPNIVDKINGNINIKSINFFLMTDIFTDIVFQSQDIKSSRILEEDVWNKFLGIDEASRKDIKKIIAYQWKVESKIKSKDGICTQDIKKIFTDLSQDENFLEYSISIQKLITSIKAISSADSNSVNHEALQDYNLFIKFSMVRKQGLIFAISILMIIVFGIISGYGGNRFTECMDNNCTFNIQGMKSNITKEKDKYVSNTTK